MECWQSIAACRMERSWRMGRRKEMVRVHCDNRECKLHRRGECTAKAMHVIMVDDGMMVLCPEATVDSR